MPFCALSACSSGMSSLICGSRAARLVSISVICERSVASFFLPASTFVAIPSTCLAASSSSSRRGGSLRMGRATGAVAGAASPQPSVGTLGPDPQPSSGPGIRLPQSSSPIARRERPDTLSDAADVRAEVRVDVENTNSPPTTAFANTMVD